jgi:hypothetical protein
MDEKCVGCLTAARNFISLINAVAQFAYVSNMQIR